MSDNRHTLYGADGRYESTNRMPEPKLPGDRVEGPEGSLVWDGQVWVVSEDDDRILAGLMRRIVSDDYDIHTDLIDLRLIIDGSTYLTPEERKVVRRLLQS